MQIEAVKKILEGGDLVCFWKSKPLFRKWNLFTTRKKHPIYYFCSKVVTLNQTHNVEIQYNIQA